MLLAIATMAAAQNTGAIWTTTQDGTAQNGNVAYPLKADVYLKGSGYDANTTLYVRVIAPGGNILSPNDGVVVTDANGEFGQVQIISLTGVFADTTNDGGEYRVLVDSNTSFRGAKNDNFKVDEDDEVVLPPQGLITGFKFFDANANGVFDLGDSPVASWTFTLTVTTPDQVTTTTTVITDSFGLWTGTEYYPQGTTFTMSETLTANQYCTSASVNGGSNTIVGMASGTVSVGGTIDSTDVSVEFGNLSLGAGGGHTLGFWSNKNGQALTSAADLALLTGLNLRNANGSDFVASSLTAFKNWLLNGNATNMAYMLSVQLAAMSMNVAEGWVNPSALVYAPGCTGIVNINGFATIGDVMAAANTSLLTNNVTVASGATRTYQEALKNALDKANNNLNFVNPP
jgi:hypothetical protein